MILWQRMHKGKHGRRACLDGVSLVSAAAAALSGTLRLRFLDRQLGSSHCYIVHCKARMPGAFLQWIPFPLLVGPSAPSGLAPPLCILHEK